MKTITWNEVMPGDVITAEDGMEWFVHDRSDRGEVALQRAGTGIIVGSPDLAAPVVINYRGRLGQASDLLAAELEGEVISHGA